MPLTPQTSKCFLTAFNSLYRSLASRVLPTNGQPSQVPKAEIKKQRANAVRGGTHWILLRTSSCDEKNRREWRQWQKPGFDDKRVVSLRRYHSGYIGISAHMFCKFDALPLGLHWLLETYAHVRKQRGIQPPSCASAFIKKSSESHQASLGMNVHHDTMS